MIEIVLATGNPGKLREMRALFDGLPIELRAQSEFDIPEAVESGTTFIENALIKARHASQLCGCPAIADDSGLAVDALGGAPGVYSARYAGADADDQANNAKLLEALNARPGAPRTARFICVMACISHPDDPTPIIAQAQWPGEILPAGRGNNGFGYDPLFLIPALQKTSAELPAEQKNRISHRAQAAAILVDALTVALADRPQRVGSLSADSASG